MKPTPPPQEPRNPKFRDTADHSRSRRVAAPLFEKKNQTLEEIGVGGRPVETRCDQSLQTIRIPSSRTRRGRKCPAGHSPIRSVSLPVHRSHPNTHKIVRFVKVQSFTLRPWLGTAGTLSGMSYGLVWGAQAPPLSGQDVRPLFLKDFSSPGFVTSDSSYKVPYLPWLYSAYAFGNKHKNYNTISTARIHKFYQLWEAPPKRTFEFISKSCTLTCSRGSGLSF